MIYRLQPGLLHKSVVNFVLGPFPSYISEKWTLIAIIFASPTVFELIAIH